MQRHESEYQRRKLAWNLLQHPGWTELLLPLLEISVNKPIPPILSLDDSFKAAKVQGEKELARTIIERFNRHATEFVKRPVEGTEAPIIIPE